MAPGRGNSPSMKEPKPKRSSGYRCSIPCSLSRCSCDTTSHLSDPQHTGKVERPVLDFNTDVSWWLTPKILKVHIHEWFIPAQELMVVDNSWYWLYVCKNDAPSVCEMMCSEHCKGVFNQQSQPSNFSVPRRGKLFGYDQKGVRGSNLVVRDSNSVVRDSKSFKKLPKL